MIKKIISIIIILVVLTSSIYYIIYEQNQKNIAIYNQKVANFIQELKALNCSVTNMTLNEIAIQDCGEFMLDDKTRYTWESDGFNSIRWLSQNELKEAVGNHSYTSNNFIHAWSLYRDVHDFALVKLDNNNCWVLSVGLVPSQTIWSYEHLGVSFSVGSE
jgi:hypothetical protein